MYPCEWKAGEGERNGIATFMVDGERFVVALDSFDDLQIISKMLTRAENQGRNSVADLMCNSICNKAKELCERFTTYNNLG